MSIKKSAGILLYRKNYHSLEVFLVHPGGPFWKNKDTGAWSIPKGELTDDEDPLNAAKRELEEETGITCQGPFIVLPVVKQKGGKSVYAWAVQQDADPAAITSNTFPLEWPPKSGIINNYPEIDKAGWFTEQEAKQKINNNQAILIDELIIKLTMIEVIK